MSNLINAMIANLLGWGFFPSQGTAVALESTSFRGGKGGMSKAWQQALISTTIFAWAEFLPTENCHSGELCTGGLIVGRECGAAWHPALPSLLLLALYLSRSSFMPPLYSLCLFSIQIVWVVGCVKIYWGVFGCIAICLCELRYVWVVFGIIWYYLGLFGGSHRFHCSLPAPRLHCWPPPL